MQVAENHHHGWKRPAAAALLAPAVLLLASMAMFWKLVLTDQYTWLEGVDTSKHLVPVWQFQAGEWHQGRYPLWDPNHWYGQPLLGQAQPGAAYPLNWILFALPLKDGWLKHYYLNWYFVLTRFLAALFCYWLCRDLGRSHAASIIAGCAFAFSGVLSGNEWPQMFNAIIWTPLVFLFIFRAWRGERPLTSAWLAGLYLGVAWLAGHHQVPIYVSLAACFLWLYMIVRDRRLARAFALFLVAVGLTSALQTLTALEYGRNARRWVGAAEPLRWDQAVPYNIHAEYATPAASLTAIVLPGRNVHTDPFVGPTVLALAALGLWVGFGVPAVGALAAIGVLGLLLALGPATFVHGLMYSAVPLVEKARVPAMAVLLLCFSFSVLTAWGIDNLSDRRRVVRVAALLALSGLTIVAVVRPADNRTFTVGITAMLAAGVLLAFRNRAAAPLAIGLVVLIELSTVVGTYYPNRHDQQVTRYLNKFPQTADTVEFLRTRPQPLRVDINDDDIPFNFGDFYGVSQASGYLASLSDNLFGLEFHTERTQQLLAVGYLIAREPKRANQTLLFTGRHGLRVFENPGALPRARIVHRLVRVTDRAAVGAFVSDPANDLSTTAPMVSEPPALETCTGADEARIVTLTPNDITIRARLACRGMLVLADTNFPGWRATVDGRAAPIHEVYGALRGVVVERGEHTIEMTYRPWTALAGGVMTLAGLASGLIVWLIGRR